MCCWLQEVRKDETPRSLESHCSLEVIAQQQHTHTHTMQARNRVAAAEKHFTEQVFQCSLSLTNGVEPLRAAPEDHQTVIRRHV